MRLVCLHLLLMLLLSRTDTALSADTDVAEQLQMSSDGPRAGRAAPLCHLSEKELHTTVRSAAVSALKGTCNPAELEERLVAMETRLSQQLEEMKASLSRLLLENVVYDYEEEEEGEGNGVSATSREQHRYSGGASANGKAGIGDTSSGGDVSGGKESSQAALTHYNELRSNARRNNGQRTSYKRYNAATQVSGNRAAAAQTTTAQAGSRTSLSSSSEQQQGRGNTNIHNKHDGRDTYNTVRRNDSVGYSRVRAGDRRPGGRAGYRRGRTSYHTAAGEHRRYNTGSFQYTTAQNGSSSESGTRQVSGGSLDSRNSAASNRGHAVRYSTSYTPTKSADPYTKFSGAVSGSTSFKGRRQSRREQARRRGQYVTDTVSYITGAESTSMSRFWEINRYNDTVYELNDKRIYSYYWEVKDLDTMMATWEDRHSLRSPSFYVYQGGYHMYLRVFPSRQGGNVYMHAGLTPGRYDALLSWPFRLRLRMSLLDHSAVPHDIASRVWDPRHLCSGWNWRRPRGKDNYECVGLGFPQQLLHTRRFLLDGAALIKLDVILEE